MIAVVIAMALQATGQAAGAPQTHSILVSDCPEGGGGDIVVCARRKGDVRLPLPMERPPVGPMLVPGAAARMDDPMTRGPGGAPCAASMGGCQVGFGPPLMPVITGAAGLLKNAFARKPDKSKRIPIPLDGPTPASPQDVHP